MRLVLATRGSRLARAQAQQVADALLRAWPELEVDLEIVSTKGDELLDRSVEAIGKGAFVKEIQAAVLAGRADVAVHSFKDLPTGHVPGLIISAVPTRADPRDALVTDRATAFTYLAEGAVIGTSSRRRAAQLMRRRADLTVVPMRGNVNTRLEKLAAGDVDALVLAAAGLTRLGLDGRITESFDVEQMVPAAGQGALALEIREDDEATGRILAPLNDPDTVFEVSAERACLAALGGGCNVPIGVHARATADAMRIDGIVVTPDGRKAAKMRWSGPRTMPAAEVGDVLADLLTQTGAREILASETSVARR